MTNTKLIFLSTQDDERELECFANSLDQITVSITDEGADHAWNRQHVSLDISTAIKLHKVLRAEINKVKEAQNG